MTWREQFRQLRHHRAFRIPPPEWPPEQQEQLAALLRALGAANAAAGPGPGIDGPGPGIDEPGPDIDSKALATAATNLWRARRRLTQQTGGDRAQARQAGRYLQACQEALATAGLVVRDHDRERFHSGRSLEALVFNEDPDVDFETVTETVRPSVFLHDERIQMGQVIVSYPVRAENNHGSRHA